jgi:hypothetical protein
MKGLKTGGRRKGTRNRITAEREAAVEHAQEQITQALGPTAFDGDAHAMLMTVYKDTTQPLVLRIDAAGKAIGYEKPKLSSVDAHVDGALGTYAAQPIPVEQRDSDALESAAGPATNGHSPGHG